MTQCRPPSPTSQGKAGPPAALEAGPELPFRGLLDAAPTAILVVDGAGRILFANAEAERTFGWPAGELPGGSIEELIPLGLRDRHRQLRKGYRRSPAHRQMSGRELPGIRRDGTVFPAEVGLGPIAADGRQLVLVAVNDISERHRVEIAYRASEERYRLLFEANPQPMWVFDIETLRILDVNDAAVGHYGYSRGEFLAMTILDLRPAEDAPAVLEAVAAPGRGLRRVQAWRHRRRDGSLIDVEVRAHDLDLEGRPARLVLAVDVTDQRRLEEELRQAQKMEAVGRLAGGIAHDFNNLLTAINGYAELATSEVDEGSRVAADLEQIHRAGERAAGLVRQLLAFGRRQVLAPQLIEPDELVGNLEEMLRRLIGEDVEFATALGAPGARVLADPGQIEQVVVNLVVNARDALRSAREAGRFDGRLTVETSRIVLGEADAASHLGGRPGPHVLLAVSDTGGGMDAETLSHVFEPFFTTKQKGEGTGLGLATAYGIVSQSGGTIWAYSEPGKGSTFKVYLPLSPDDEQAAAAEERPLAAPRGSETILLVEDEPAVLSFAAQVLRRQGYRVLTASDARSALRVAKGSRAAIDLLLTDVVMPGADGIDLARQLVARRPGLAVLLMSGYADEAVVRHGLLRPGADYLGKPFSPTALSVRVREVLDAGARAADPGADGAPGRDGGPGSALEEELA